MNEPKITSEVHEIWGVLELMGHVRIAGRISEEEKFGSKIGRIDIPLEGGEFVTQYFGGGSVYRITIVSEEVARSVAKSHANPIPISAWELPKQIKASVIEENNLQDE